MVSVLFAAMLAAATPSPDAVLGMWKSPTKNALIAIEKCGSSICGRLVASDDIRANPTRKDVNNKDPKLQGRQLKGITMLSGFHEEDGSWVDGSVYNGADGRTYGGKITVTDPNHLKLRGCVFVPLCKTETWTRAQ